MADNPQSEVDRVADDQADIQQFMQSLIREHLEKVLDANQPPIPDGPMELETCRFMAQISIEALRKDGEVLAAELLQAMLQLSQASTEGDVEHINDFLQRAIGIMMSKEDAAERFRTYLESILLDLSRRCWFDLEQPPSPTGSTVSPSLATTTEPCVTLHVGDRTMPLLFCDILPTFWGTLLDTNCHKCQQPIIDEPPIRTIARVDPSLATASGIHVRVTNRHFSCLRAENFTWIPVSHVWDDSIRRANDSRTYHCVQNCYAAN